MNWNRRVDTGGEEELLCFPPRKEAGHFTMWHKRLKFAVGRRSPNFKK